MNAINNVVQKVFVLGIAVCFMFVAIYVPQNWNKVNEAEAAFATTGLQIVQQVQLALTAARTNLISIATASIEWFQSSIWTKEWILDGIGWWIAKMILSQVSRQIVIWINSGFQGSPAFVQDLEGFALRMADQAAGLYLANLGSPLLTQFVCAPFRLNLQIAISASYNYGRSMFPYGASRCTLTQAMQNVDRFTDGSFMHGGWNAWYRISAQPLTYTPYGEYLAAQNQLALNTNVTIRNQNAYLGFGNGFFSNKFCDVVATAAVPRERCMVSTPGHVISENLNFHLTAGSRSLIAADEINEILGALLGQLAQTAITGAHGLLGMSNNTGYTLQQGHIDTMEGEQSATNNSLIAKNIGDLDKQLAMEQKYLTLVTQAIPLLERVNTTESLKERDRAILLQAEIQQNIDTINRLRNILIVNNPTPDDLTRLANEYATLKLHTETQYNSDADRWLGLFEREFNMYKGLNDRAQDGINSYIVSLGVIRDTGRQPFSGRAREELEKIENIYQPMITDQKAELEKIAIEWNDPGIPKVNVLQHFIDLKDGNITGIPPLFTSSDLEKVLQEWADITQHPI